MPISFSLTRTCSLVQKQRFTRRNQKPLTSKARKCILYNPIIHSYFISPLTVTGQRFSFILTYGLPLSVTFVRPGLNICDWIMLTDSPTGIVNVQPILEAIWLFLLGSCRRLANAAPSPSISSGFDPDICPRCPVPSVSCAREFREREDYVPDAEHKLRFFFFFSPASDTGCLIRSNSRGYSREPLFF